MGKVSREVCDLCLLSDEYTDASYIAMLEMDGKHRLALCIEHAQFARRLERASDEPIGGGGMAVVDAPDCAACGRSNAGSRECPHLCEICNDVGKEGPAKKVPAKKVPAKKRARRKPTFSARDVRAWAAENGVEVPARGRVPQAAKDAYLAAQG